MNLNIKKKKKLKTEGKENIKKHFVDLQEIPPMSRDRECCMTFKKLTDDSKNK